MTTTTTTQFLLELPVVLQLADWVWGEDATVTPKICLDTIPFMPNACWTGLLAKGIGIGIILASCLNKLPIILNLLASQSAAGTPTATVYGETLVYANSAVYGLLHQHSFTSWGENLALLIQSLVILILIWRFALPSFMERSIAGAAAVVYVTVVTTALPLEQSHYLLQTSVPLLLAARGTQLLTTIRCQHTGSQSVVTLGMNVTGALIRIATTIREVGLDWAVLGTHCVSLALSTTMLLQIFYYRKNTARFLADLQLKEEKKAS